MSTPVGFVIQPGQTIPEDVLRFRTSDGEIAYRDETGLQLPWRLVSCENPGQCCTHGASEFEWPLTVTAVREQPAEPVSGLCEVAADGYSCRVTAEEHRRIYHGGLPAFAEPQPVDVLDLVRRYAVEVECGDGEPHAQRAEALFDQIREALAKLTAERAEVQDAYEQSVRVGQKAVDMRDRLIQERDEARAHVERLITPSDSGACMVCGHAQPDPAAPLTLPEVPPGTVALVGVESGRLYEPLPEGGWAEADESTGFSFAEVLEREHPHGVTPEFAPPREPRTWTRLDGSDLADLPAAVEVGGMRYERAGDASYIHLTTGGLWDWWSLRGRGDVTEVLDGEAGTR